MTPSLYVLCSGQDAFDGWTKRAAFHHDLDVKPQYPVRSAIQRIHEIAAEVDRPFLVCRDSIWIGLGMGRQVELLLDELNRRHPNWAVCGNRGVRWDGQVLDFSRDVRVLGLQTSLVVHAVISVDDNLMLVNPHQLRRHSQPGPAIPSLYSGVPLSLECLRNGSLACASTRLMAIRAETEGPDLVQQLEKNAQFRQWYRSNFVNHAFTVPDGTLELSTAVDYSYVTEPVADVTQADLLELYDQALAAAPRKPTLTLCCRTQFQRPEMLDRAVLSFSVCRDFAALLGDFQIRLVTDQPPAVAEPAIRRLEAVYPAARLECWFHAVREKRLSRIDLLRAAVERAETDYIWFVDDDDYVNPASMAALARCLIPDCPLIVITSSPVAKERWEGSGGTHLKLASAERGGSYPAGRIFKIFGGDNEIPICGMILPVKLLRERLRNRAALGEYCEDYFLLLLALTAPRVEVSILDVELATVSSRGLENTTAQTDRSLWHQSSATFLLEVLNNEEGNSPLLWQQGNVSLWRWDF